MFLRIIAAVFAIIVMQTVNAYASTERVALVIGNSNYAHVGRLKNPVSDAAAIAGALTNLGFDVTLVTDATKAKFDQVLGDFSEKASDADLALVYYAGHGLEMGGVNYLIPVDAVLKTDLRVPLDTISLNTILNSISGAKKLRMVLLDACRNNPFVENIKRSVNSTRSIGRGLADVEAGPNELISYAAYAGAEASDGNGVHSPYTTALLANIQKPGVEIGKLFRIVADQVQRETAGNQVPYENARLPAQDIFLRDPDPVEKPVVTADVESNVKMETSDESSVALDWKAAEESNNADVIAAFLQEHGDNKMYSLLATQKLALLKSQQVTLMKTPAVAVEVKPVVTKQEPVPAPEMDCDRLAANPDDPLKLASVKGVVVPKIDVEHASIACTTDILRYPAEARFKYQYARVLNAEGKHEEALKLYIAASDLGYSTADANIGLSYAYGVGVEANIRIASTWLKKSMDAKNAIAFCGNAETYNDGLDGTRDGGKALDLATKCIRQGSKFGFEVRAAIMSKSGDFEDAAHSMFFALKAGRQSALLSLTENDQSWPTEFRKAFQERLKTEGLYTGRVDGNFDAETKSAISAVYDRSQ